MKLASSPNKFTPNFVDHISTFTKMTEELTVITIENHGKHNVIGT